MKMFPFIGLLFILLTANQSFAQYKSDNPNLDQIPQYLRERASASVDGTTANSAVVTIDNWDNYSLGVDFAENNMATDPNNPTWFFTAYNTNETHHTENGIDWAKNNPSFGATMSGDPVVAYDSIGNLFYENMYGSTILGCKVVKSTTNGASWSPSVTAISGNDKNWIACDQTSGPYANYIYTTMTNNGVGNFARSIDNGATFSSTFAPSTQSLPGMMVCVGPQGNVQGGSVYVVTNGGSQFNATYTFYLSTNGGSSFVQKSSQQFANTVGTQVSNRSSVSNMRTRPYPMIAADNSYGPNRGKFYCVYASNDPPGNNNKSDVWCRNSSDGGTTWSAAVRINDDPNTQSFQQWHPAIWCDKETGKLYAMWMDTRDTPTNDSAFIYASYSIDGGTTWVPNQRISNKKMKINCTTCGGGGTPAYEGDYNGVVSNKKVSMLGWTDFRSGNFQSMTGYFPDYAMAIDKASDTLYAPVDNTTFQVSIPAVKLYADTVILSAVIAPVPTSGSISFEYPSGTTMTTYPDSRPVKLVLTGDVPIGTYMATFYATGPNGTPAHKRTATIKVLQGNAFVATASASPLIICEGLMTQLNVTTLGGTSPFTYSWTPVAGVVNPNSATTFATPSETTMYHIIVSDNGSNTAVDSVLVTVNHAPPAPGPITGLQNVCNGVIAEYSVLEVVGSDTYSWTVPADAQIMSGQNTPVIMVQWGSTSGDLQVIAGNDCGPSGPSVLPVVVNMPPASPTAIIGPDVICKNATSTFSTTYTGGSATFIWDVPADASIQSGQGTESITVLWGLTAGNVQVYLSNDCGTSPLVTKQVGVNSIPEPAGVITGNDTVCLGEGNYIYNIPAITGATEYEWTLPQGVTIAAGQGTNQVTLAVSGTAQSGNILVKGTNVCGSGVESSKAVTVDNCTGIGKKDLESVVKIFPNPVKEELTINIAGNEKSLQLTIADLNGKILYSEKLTISGDEFRKKLDMSGFAKGIYFVKLTVNDRSFSEKVVVQ